jgi:hypothetical protein
MGSPSQPKSSSAHTTEAEAARDDLIAGLRDVRSSILETAADLGPGVRDEVFLGTWSARALVAHLIGWDYTNIRAINEVLDGKLPSFYDARDHDWQTYNALLVERYKESNYRSLLRHARRSHRSLIERIRKTPAEDLRRDRGIRARGWKVTIERLLLAELSDERTHLEQLKGLAARRRRARNADPG